MSQQATRVLKSLMHYIKTEQKDRIHTINHYQHVQESDPVEAESIRSDIADHLRGTDQRVTQAIDMLDQLPKYEKKIRAQIGTYCVRCRVELYELVKDWNLEGPGRRYRRIEFTWEKLMIFSPVEKLLNNLLIRF